jgi:pimeloyl-ACP methyl ester carboxylesterase
MNAPGCSSHGKWPASAIATTRACGISAAVAVLARIGIGLASPWMNTTGMLAGTRGRPSTSVPRSACSAAGEATSEDSREALAMVWPNYFADPATAFPMPPLEFGAAGYAGTTASVAEHAERGTLVDGLPRVPASIPVVFIHGEASPMPMRASTATAALIPHARVVAIADAGHFPWLEQPGAFMSALDM